MGGLVNPYMFAAYITTAKDFDGSTMYSTRGSVPTGLFDGTKFLFNLCFRIDAIPAVSDGVIWSNVNRRAILKLVRVDASHATISFSTVTPGGGNVWVMAPATQFTAGSWHQVTASGDAATASSGFMLIDGSLVINATTAAQNANADYADSDFVFGARVDGSFKFSGCLSEPYINLAENLDLSLSANQLKFRSAAGKPVGLGTTGELPTGTQAGYYSPSGDPESNVGSWGAFTNAAALGSCSSSPSD